MGVDCVWLMPIHPIGQLGRKGNLGSPYSVSDFFEVNPEYGNKAELARLLRCAHNLGLRVILDVVVNHSARDCQLVEEHPDWYANAGSRRNTLPDWTDVQGFDHGHPEVCDYLIGVLKYWAEFGFDGFRCDVASFLPLDFWLAARTRLQVNFPNLIWLAESTYWSLIAERRAAGLPILSDSELYEAFDLTFDYDAFAIWQAAVLGVAPLWRYAEILRIQDGIYRSGAEKVRFVENHDHGRILALAPGKDEALAWTAFQAFNRGAFLMCAGQEAATAHMPSLFERDPIDWGGYELQAKLARMAALKKEPALRDGHFTITAADSELQAAWQTEEESLYGIFDVLNCQDVFEVPLPDGGYTDVLNGERVEVQGGKCRLHNSYAVLRCQGNRWKPFYSDVLNFSAGGMIGRV
jgi:Alpha amylase, catalytic domain/Bacterial Alpha amylase C-terminal domain